MTERSSHDVKYWPPVTKAKAGSMITMQCARKFLRRFLEDESGAAAIEYGLIVAGVAMALIPFLPNLGNFYESMFNKFTNTINNMSP